MMQIKDFHVLQNNALYVLAEHAITLAPSTNEFWNHFLFFAKQNPVVQIFKFILIRSLYFTEV